MTGSDVALLVLRVVLGAVYLVHGARKLGWIGRGGFADFAASIARRGFRPPVLWAAAAVGAEVAGGALAVGGLLTPLAGALLVAQSTVIALLLAPRGFWHTDEGIEYPLVLGGAAAAVGLLGPGAVSLDRALGIRFQVGLAELLVAAGLAAGLVSALARRGPPAAAATRDDAGSGVTPAPPR
jgi:putative oxidoreductase